MRQKYFLLSIYLRWEAKISLLKIKAVLFLCFSYFVPMPQLTPDFNRVIVFGFLTPDATNFVAEDFCKVVQMTYEILSCEDYCLSYIFIFDAANYTASHIPKMTITSVKKCEVCAIVSTDIAYLLQE